MNKKSIAGIVSGVLLSIIISVGAYRMSGDPPAPPNNPTPVPAPDNPTPTPEPTPADPDNARVVINAPTDVNAGELVVLDVSGSNATSYAWKVVPPTKDFMVIDGGKRAVFSHGASGAFLFIVSAAKGDTVDVKTHTMKVTGPDQPPSPDDIGAKVAGWCKSVESPSKRDDALKLGQSFLSVSATIAAGVVTTPADIVAATKRSNQDALGDAVKHWEPFLVALQAELKAQAEAGLLPDSEAHAKAWRAIGEGLKKYAESMK